MLLKISFVTKLSLFFTYIPPVLKVFVIKKNAQGCFDLKSFAAQKKKKKSIGKLLQSFKFEFYY